MFAGHGFYVMIHNPDKIMPDDAKIKSALCDGKNIENIEKMSVRISKEDIDKLSREKRHVIEIYI